MEEMIRQTSIKLAQVGEALGVRNLDPDAGLIFVTGEGVVGHRVAMKLLNAGYPQVRLAAHNPDHLERFNKMGAELADFAWDNEVTYATALDNVKTVVCTVPYTMDWHKHFPAFLKACEKAGVRHFIKLSFYHARRSGDPFQEVPLVKQHGDCDDLLIRELSPSIDNAGQADTDVGVEFGTPHMGYTIIAASHYMSNPFFFQGQELHNKMKPAAYYGASGNKGVNYVSPNDVAECVVRVALEPRAHYNKEYTITGPEAITEQTVAALLSKHLGKPVMYVDQPVREFEIENRLGGEPEWMVRDLVAMEEIKATGTEESVGFLTDDFEKICGHKPQTFEEYLVDTDMMTPMERGVPPALKPLKPEFSE